ncbi:MAG: hypothetical protein R3B47_17060 [Bacteroidia bacterium]
MRSTLLIAIILNAVILPAQYFPNLEWQRFYGKKGDDRPEAMALASDGSLLLGGSTVTHRPDEEPDHNAWVVKVDTNGYELWEREVRLPGRQEITDLRATEDGGVIFCGSSSDITGHPEPASPQFRSDFFVGKLNALGEVEWLKHYGGSGFDRALCLTRGVYNEWLVAGLAHSPGGVGEVKKNMGQSDLWMLKLDDQGEIRLNQSLGGAYSDWANSVVACRNGDFVLAGYSSSPSLDRGPVSAYGNGWIMRLDPQGNVLWTRLFYCAQGGGFSKVIEMEDERLALVGTRANENGQHQGWFLKLSPDGARVQEELFSLAGQHELTCIASCEGGGLLLGGYSQGDTGPEARGDSDFWLYRLNAQGEVVWRNAYGGPDFERCMEVLEAGPGLYYALGQKVNDFDKQTGSRGKDFWLLKIREYDCKHLQASIFVRTSDGSLPVNQRVRFRAEHEFATDFEWDFGDGTSSLKSDPLKALPAWHVPAGLTVYANKGLLAPCACLFSSLWNRETGFRFFR